MNRVLLGVVRLADAAFPLVLALFLMSLVEWSTTDNSSAVRWGTALAAMVAGLSLYKRRTYPVQVMVANLVAGVPLQLHAPEGLFPWGALVALWALSARRPVVYSLPALAGVVGLTLLVMPQSVFLREDVEFAVIVAVAVWAVSWGMRSHRLMIEQAVARQAVEDQSRLARDIHDVIAHSVSVIVVQAAAADDVFDRRPERAREALRSIEATGRDALTELRRLLAAGPGPSSPVNSAVNSAAAEPSQGPGRPWVFRRFQEQGAEAVKPLAPQPTLARLRPDIISPLEAAGLEIDLAVDGDVDGLSLGVQLTAFRIVQEALTNVLRHGGGAGAQVRLDVGDKELSIVVENVCRRLDGVRPPGIAGAGRGLQGMRERAALVGGVLEAGAVGDEGFRVVARLPAHSAVRL
nr:histidine kinase [Kineosporia rhizophila]